MKPELPYLFSGGATGGPVSEFQHANNTRLISEQVAIVAESPYARSNLYRSPSGRLVLGCFTVASQSLTILSNLSVVVPSRVAVTISIKAFSSLSQHTLQVTIERRGEGLVTR